MRLKKNRPEEPKTRTVVRSGDSPTAFSYYSSRAPLERTDALASQRRNESMRPQNSASQASLLNRLTRGVTVALLILLVIGASTLSGTAQVRFTGNIAALSEAERTQYQKDTDSIVGAGILNRFKLTIDPQGIAAKLTEQHPEFQDVSVVVPVLTRQVYVMVALSEPVARLQHSGQLYGIDPSGYVIGSSGVSDALPEVVDESGIVPRLGEQMLPRSTVDSINVIATQLTAAQRPLSRIVLQKDTPYELTVYLEGRGYRAKFNIKADPLQQSGALIATLKHLGDFQPKEYIDVRVPGRVYYK